MGTRCVLNRLAHVNIKILCELQDFLNALGLRCPNRQISQDDVFHEAV